MINQPASFAEVIAALQKAGKLPRNLSADQLAKLQRALAKYSSQVSQKTISTIIGDFQDKLTAAQSLTEPAAIRGAIYDLANHLSPDIAGRVRFALHISQQVASGGGRYLNQNLSPEVVQEYPALELLRMFARHVPRGFELGPKGGLIPVPDDDWPSRWQAAGGELVDGRMVALKSDPIWQALGDGVGGYDDTLENPFPPFAFNSGFMTVDVSRKDAIALGVMGEGEQVEPAPIDFTKFFSEVA